MSQTLLVAVDGSEGAERALDHAVELAKASQATILVAHIIEWSPYSFLSQDEIAQRHKRRQEELSRAEEHLITPVTDKLSQQGIQAKGIIKYGNIAKSLCSIAEEEQANQIIIGRTGDDSFTDRLFGTVPGALVQVSPVPVTVVP
jgi:nucleotide-binding universal stress UspA family protein